MLDTAIRRVEGLPDDASVLDVGGWAKPLARADWVIDLLPYETRGLYGYENAVRADERFTEDTWVTRDVCATEPWPFEDGQFDFVVCAHTLEDLRDPVRVCEELVRVARAGYVEVPAPVEELTWGLHGPWVGWSHHRWICELEGSRLTFNHKPHLLCAPDRHHAPGHCDGLSDEQRVLCLWWEDSFEFGEVVRVGAEDFDIWLADLLQRTSRPDQPRRRRAGRFRRRRS